MLPVPLFHGEIETLWATFSTRRLLVSLDSNAGFSITLCLGWSSCLCVSDRRTSFCGVAGGVPRTPVRQKMKTMSRSLQMLNVARLNVKAQRFQPDGAPPTVNEKVPQKLSAKRGEEKVEGKEKALKISIGV